VKGGFRINVLGIERLRATFERQGDKARGPLFEAVRQGAHLVIKKAKDGIRKGPKTGRIYTHRFPDVFEGGPRRARYRRRVPHQASAPGEYPAADTGNLMRSIHDEHGVPSEEAAAGFDAFAAYIYADAEYAAPLEFKPEEKGGRPFLRRALTESEDEIIDLCEAALRGVFGP
jgi:hypothetical protein